MIDQTPIDNETVTAGAVLEMAARATIGRWMDEGAGYDLDELVPVSDLLVDLFAAAGAPLPGWLAAWVASPGIASA